MGQFPATTRRPELAALDLIIAANLSAFWQRSPQRRCEDCGRAIRRDLAESERLCAICLRAESLVSARRWSNVVDQITRIGGFNGAIRSTEVGRYDARLGITREHRI